MIEIRDFSYRGVLHHFNGYYLDLDSQRVWSEKTKRWMKTWKNSWGYVHVQLYATNGKCLRHINLSRLVWTIANGMQIPDGYQVNHIDEDKENNHPSNLELVTPSQNVNHGTRNARAGRAISAAMRGKKKAPEHVARMAAARRGKPNVALSKAVAQLTLDGQLVRTWPSTNEAGRNGWQHQNISACCRKCYRGVAPDVYKGYRWMWLEEYEKAQA